MSENFSINTTFNPIKINTSFNNPIVNPEIQGSNDFEKIFNSMSDNTFELSGGISLDNIQPYQKPENLSSVAKMAHDISAGLTNSINELNNYHKAAEKNMETFAAGGDISIHEVMISSQKSALATQMAIQLRNQFINAYNELRNIQL